MSKIRKESGAFSGPGSYTRLYSGYAYCDAVSSALLERRRKELEYVAEYMFPLLHASFQQYKQEQGLFQLTDRNGIITYSTDSEEVGKLIRSTRYSGPEMLEYLHKSHFMEVESFEAKADIETDKFYSMWYVLRNLAKEPFAIIMGKQQKEPCSEDYIQTFYACCQAVQLHCDYHMSQQSLIDAIPYAVLIVGTDGRIRQANAIAKKCAGCVLEGKRLESVCTAAAGKGASADSAETELVLGHKVISDQWIEHIGQFGEMEERMLVLAASARHVLGTQAAVSGGSDSCGAIIGTSPAMLSVKNTIKMVAKKPVSVLIQGESGTGKELVAKAVHQISGRKGRFIPINCGAMDRNLLYSELFGYEEGSFTGAARGGKKGKIELSDGGTLFLDEIGEMPLDMQVSLLRVLEGRSVMPVGGKSERKVDIRIVAATNRDLKGAVNQGTFRADLYFRLAVIPIHLPPLRERKEDIPELARKFAQQIGEDYGIGGVAISDQVLEGLSQYPWYGNVRELRNTLEYMILMSDDGEVTLSQLKKTMRDVAFQPEGRSGFDGAERETEREEIVRALEKCGNNKSKTAKLLGISRKTLYVRMMRYGIEY